MNPSNRPGTTKALTAQDILREEKQKVAEAFRQYYTGRHFSDDARMKTEGESEELPHIGLALSGGGIRSASFGIGVIQALSNPELFGRNTGTVRESRDTADEKTPLTPTLFDKLRYISTASGGGYAGSALTWFMRKYKVFPFGQKGNYCGGKQLDIAGINQDDLRSNHILSYIRQHGKYLTPPELGFFSLVGSVLSSALHSLIAYTLFLSLLIFMIMFLLSLGAPSELLTKQLQVMPWTVELNNFLQQVHLLSDAVSFHEKRQHVSLFFIDLSIIATLLFLLTTLLYGFFSFVKKPFSEWYWSRVKTQKCLGFLLKVIAIAAILALLPILAAIIAGAKPDLTKLTEPETWGPMGSGALAMIVSIFDFYKQQNARGQASASLISQLIRTVVVGLLIIFLLTTSYIVAEKLFQMMHSADTYQSGILYTVMVLAAPVTLAILFIVNINQISPHKMYRDRLMDTFLMDPDIPPEASIIKKSREANKVLLTELNDVARYGWSPYPLINCNVILNNAKNQKYKGRFGDSFTLSPLYCGSDATGYVDTRNFSPESMTLATAMAISGAAVNPHSDVAGVGTDTNPLVSFLMTFFGLRLGYWCHNPSSILTRWKWMRWITPNYVIPGICSLFNFGHKETFSFIELSDGGHFDNTGVYELVRRRVPFIIFSDGSADPDTKFDDFGNCLERIRTDFGVTIRFPNADYDLSGLLPESQAVVSETEGKPRKIYDEKYRLSQRGYAIGTIYYPKLAQEEAFEGKFIYIKTSMTRNLPGDIYSYYSLHPDFPNQPTSDQFFDERQFESYRELGYHLAKQYIQEHE